jgi:hypothetical protein
MQVPTDEKPTLGQASRWLEQLGEWPSAMSPKGIDPTMHCTGNRDGCG